MGENNRQGKIKQTTVAYSFKENWKVLSTKPVSIKTQITANQSEFLYKKTLYDHCPFRISTVLWRMSVKPNVEDVEDDDDDDADNVFFNEQYTIIQPDPHPPCASQLRP